MQVYSLDPLCDERWSEFTRTHPKAGVFHTIEWLRVLQHAYQYEPVAYTTSAPGVPLTNALLFCRIRSWLTGRRLVSLPFSDHCEPLVEDSDILQELLKAPLQEQRAGEWKYVELRPVTLAYGEGVEEHPEEYLLHRLDLRPGLDELYHKLHVASIRRKIRRAQREGLKIEVGRSQTLLQEFYKLHIMTRRRHRLPPQPRSWFQHMISCLGNMAKIHVARKAGRVVASLLTIETPGSFVYKYGCSDARFHELGGMPYLFWTMIEGAARSGHTEIDLGRSELENEGLITFKDRWGTTRHRLVYVRYPHRTGKSIQHRFSLRLAKKIFGFCPTGVLTATGNLLYRHIG